MVLKIILPVLSYIAGSIPFGLLFGKIFSKKDIRKLGSGNIGTANVIRNAGITAGILTFVCDVLKGFLPVILTLEFLDLQTAILSGLLAFSGHIFPVFLKFKGGKGVATAFGVMLALNYISALIAFGIFIIVMLIFRISSLSSMSAAISIIIINLLLKADPYILLLNMFLTIVILIAHRENIIRLLNNQEPKMWGKN